MLNSLFLLSLESTTPCAHGYRRLKLHPKRSPGTSSSDETVSSRPWVWVWMRVHNALIKRGEREHGTLEMPRLRDGMQLRGWVLQERGPPRSTLVLLWDQLSFISLSPQGAQQQTTSGGRGEGSIGEEEERSFGQGGTPVQRVHSQLGVNLFCLS